IEDLLEALAVLRPALDDLNAVEITGGGILHRPNYKCRSRALATLGHCRQVGAHRHAVCIRLVHPVLRVEDLLVESPTAEKAYLDVRPANAKSLLAIHRLPKGFPRVFFGPYTGQAARIFQTHVQGAKRQNSSHAPVDGAVDLGVTAVEVVMAVRAAGIVRVGAACHTELVRVVSPHVLHGNAVFQCLAAVAALNLVDLPNSRAQSEQSRGQLVTGKFIIGRKQGVSFRLSLDLLDLDQALVDVAVGSPGGVNGASEAVDVNRIHPPAA